MPSDNIAGVLHALDHECSVLSRDCSALSVCTESAGERAGPARGREETMPGAWAHAAHAADGFGNVEGVKRDYVRHCARTLYVALVVVNGAMLAGCKPSHRHQEFQSSLRSLSTFALGCVAQGQLQRA